jgi:formate/nitrite transporter
MNMDAYSPREIASKVQALGVTKANSDALSVLVLAVLAGAFISLGALFFTVVVTGAAAGYGINRFIGGVAFSLGLVMVLVGGGELFTGNNLVAMAWASRLTTTPSLLRNWVLVYAGNVAGALGTVALVWAGDVDRFSGGAVGQTAMAIGNAKASLGVWQALALGIMCNALVCMGVWLAMGGRTVTDRILAVVFPISAFVAIGFEHSIANWFFLPYAIALNGSNAPSLVSGALTNLAAVTLGNIIGGSLLVAGVYWLAYLRKGAQPTPAA